MFFTIPCFKYRGDGKVLSYCARGGKCPVRAENLKLWNKLICSCFSFPVVPCLQISCRACPACLLANPHQSSQSDCDMIKGSTLSPCCTRETALIQNATIDCEGGNHSGTYPQSRAKILLFWHKYSSFSMSKKVRNNFWEQKCNWSILLKRRTMPECAAWRRCHGARWPWRNAVYTDIPSKSNAAFPFASQILLSTVTPVILRVRLVFTGISLVWLIVSAFSELL